LGLASPPKKLFVISTKGNGFKVGVEQDLTKLVNFVVDSFSLDGGGFSNLDPQLVEVRRV
jgi:hypothetical protein